MKSTLSALLFASVSKTISSSSSRLDSSLSSSLNSNANTNIGSHNYGDLLANGCIGKTDGEYWLLLSIESDYLPVSLTCNNEYVILDVSKDSNLLSYFSTFEMWHYAIGGPANKNPTNWEDWFLPNNDNSNANYLISPDCNSCDSTAVRQTHDSKTSYWMTGNLAKLHWPVIGFNECDMDWESYQCYNCKSCMQITVGCDPVAYDEEDTDFMHSGICGVTVQETTHEIYDTRVVAQRASGVINYKPSIGTDGRFCMCYQPQSEQYYSLTEEQEQVIEMRQSETVNNDISDINNINGNSNNNGNNGNNDHLKVEAKIEEKYRKRGNRNKKGRAKVTNSNEGEEEEEEEQEEEETKDEMNDLRDSNIVYLEQKDFVRGTFRITESGTYVIKEDIIFDFNKDYDYWPTLDQADEYPGAAQYRDPYHLGFFAGITIETDYVTIDLNGKELKQSLEFYFQQRWFAIIELGNQQFLPGQGPAFFGPDPVTISEITIKNGVLGRTAHFGIHGNFPSGLTVQNVQIKDFVTHGMQLNGWNNLIMDNIEIGPSSTTEFLRGDYGHGRIILQRLRAIEDDMIEAGTIGKTVQFSGRSEAVTVTDVADELELQMEMAYDYAINRVEGKHAENDFIDPKYTQDTEGQERWQAAKQQFVHESGLPSASSITGLFLNFEGASVFSYTMYTTRQSKFGEITNIHIHDIYHDMVESMRVSQRNEGGQLYPTPWNSDIPAEAAFGSKDTLYNFYTVANEVYTSSQESMSLGMKQSGSSGSSSSSSSNSILNPSYTEDDLEEFGYIGSVMSDAYFAMGSFSDDWGYLGFLEIAKDDDDTALSDWVFSGAKGGTNWVFGCNQDIMGHSGKGLLGFRMDGVSNVKLDNIIIENLYQHTPLGSYACGNYYRFTPQESGGHFKQSEPMQWGFSANDLQAMSIIASTDVIIGDLLITNLNNDYSQSYGLSFWTGNDISFKEDSLIKIENIRAGILLDEGTLLYEDKPNRAPEACAVRLEIDDTSDYYQSNLNFNDELNGITNILSCDVYGHVRCLGSEEDDAEFTMFGAYFEERDVCKDVDDYSSLQTRMSMSGLSVNNNNNDNEKNNNNENEMSWKRWNWNGKKWTQSEMNNNNKISIKDGSENNNNINYYASLVAVGFVSAVVTVLMLYCHYKVKMIQEMKEMKEENAVIENYRDIAENFVYGSI